MLIYEQYAYVFPITSISVESLFNSGGFRFGVNNEEVLLRIGGLGYML